MARFSSDTFDDDGDALSYTDAHEVIYRRPTNVGIASHQTPQRYGRQIVGPNRTQSTAISLPMGVLSASQTNASSTQTLQFVDRPDGLYHYCADPERAVLIFCRLLLNAYRALGSFSHSEP